MLKAGDWVVSSRATKPDDTFIDPLTEGYTFPKTKYPDLAAAKPNWVQGTNIVIPDVNNRYFRQAGGSGAQDVLYGDAIRNIRGDFHDGFSEIIGYATEPFYVVSSNKKGSNGTASDNDNCYIGFDASRVVPTANENRVHTFTVKYYLKAINADYSAIDYLYPVGSVYICFDEVSPRDKFKYGEWEEINGKMLFGVDPTDNTMSTSGMTGGQKAVTLKVEQLPEHTHDVSVPTLQWPEEQQNVPTSGYSAKHHSLLASKTGPTGKNQPIDLMNPFIVCHIWRRTR